ncbi:LacI family DNA-binding transcriptional regulator [Sinorhizobium numidicum]|uniref:LacI family DNA-binding transcriptional regulator n=1 Tax=Sinorhizobium numidicum TaxID=680248 RepID=A0ABY8CNS4_9HYPH|nr:LacI family DNA-binding transcriptional regulator [Sinorhizobium numidicum]WEX74309.1 LacI family DNA-binding transcriptional regulator [Sinorhizobium numidicum]WEX80295.1 LacI family DNA-binding transcriptional regulator [Sinorhizobium numidicum]
MVSIKDVAALAGVSDRTVSRVVNGEGLIRPQTKKKVQKAIETLGYVPNQAARLMRTSRSSVLGLITDVVSTTPFSTDIVRGIQDTLDDTPYTLLTVNTSANPAKEQRAWQIFREHGIGGVFYVTMFHRHVSSKTEFPNAPTVLVNCSAPERALPSVVPDDYQGGLDVVRYLVEQGHRKIAYVMLNELLLAADLRGRAFFDGLAAAGIEVRKEWVVPGRVGAIFADRFVAFENARRLLSSPDRPTAIVCGNDETALQVYCAAADLGLRVPNDVSVVGFDDFQVISTGIQPPLTTMALPYRDMGALAVRMLVDIIAGRSTAESQVKYPCELIRRGSVASLK